MAESKIIELISSFSIKELKDLEQFLQYSKKSSNRDLLKVFLYLKNRGSDSDFDKKEIHRLCFGAKKQYDDKKVRYLLTDLTKKMEEFLSYQAFLKEHNWRKLFLQPELSQRNCSKAYQALYRELKERTKKEIIQDADFYHQQYIAEYNHLIYQEASAERGSERNIETVMHYLDKFYITQKLKICCEIYNVRNILSTDYTVFLLDEILNYLQNHSYEDSPVIQVYSQILLTLLHSEEEEHFESLSTLLLLHETKFTQKELREMYQYALNYCIKKINQGNTSYQRVLFDLYKRIVHNLVILTDRYLSQWDYKNIVTISMRLKEYDWGRQFINQFKSYIKPIERENAYNYNLANLYFNEGNYSQTLSLLQKVEFTDVYYQLDSRAILLKLYFEQEEQEALLYHATAFKNFIQRNKLISDYQRSIYSNLIKYTVRLMKSNGRMKQVEKIKAEIKENPQIADLGWLNKKLERELKRI